MEKKDEYFLNAIWCMSCNLLQNSRFVSVITNLKPSEFLELQRRNAVNICTPLWFTFFTLVGPYNF
jgi:hypothetical protein